jgi:DNA-binding MarR family transcriptional regulator
MFRAARTLYLINRVNATVSSHLERTLRRFDVTVAQYTCMSRMRGRETMSSAKLARERRVSPQTMSEMIANLEKRGLVSRDKEAIDRRELLVSLTDRGLELLDMCDRAVDEIEPEFFIGINSSDHAVFRKLLEMIINNGMDAEKRLHANDSDPIYASPRGAAE